MDTGTLLALAAGLASLLFGLLVLFFGISSSPANDSRQRLSEFVDLVCASRAARRPSRRPARGAVRLDRGAAADTRSSAWAPVRPPDPTEDHETLAHQLAIAGNPLGLGARELYGLRLLFTLLGFWLDFMLAQVVQIPGSCFSPRLSCSSAATCQVLAAQSSARSPGKDPPRPARRPTCSACALRPGWARSGHPACQRALEDPVAVELGRVVQEMEMGVQRQQALRNLADRIDIMELSSFVAVIIQSDQLGMSIAETLHVQG